MPKKKVFLSILLVAMLTACGGEQATKAPVDDTALAQSKLNTPKAVATTASVALSTTVATGNVATVANVTPSGQATATSGGAAAVATPTTNAASSPTRTVASSTSPAAIQAPAGGTSAGKDNACVTVAAFSVESLATVQKSYGLDKALAAQEPIVKSFRADARPFEASLTCSNGKLSWSVNWTSNTDKSSWVFGSFAEDGQNELQARLKQGLAVYADPQTADHKTLTVQGTVGLDKVALALGQKGVAKDAKILSATLSTSTSPERYLLVLEPNAPQPNFAVDASNGNIVG